MSHTRPQVESLNRYVNNFSVFTVLHEWVFLDGPHLDSVFVSPIHYIVVVFECLNFKPNQTCLPPSPTHPTYMHTQHSHTPGQLLVLYTCILYKLSLTLKFHRIGNLETIPCIVVARMLCTYLLHVYSSVYGKKFLIFA